MAATVYLSETNGPIATPVVTNNIYNLNFGSYDEANQVAGSHPIIIGQCSYGKWLRVRLADLGGSTQIANIRFYKSSGDYKTGEAIGGSCALVLASGLISAYGKAVASSEDVTMPVTGDGSAVLGTGVAYDDAGVPVAAPETENIAIAGGASGALSAAGYSDYTFLGLLTTVSTPGGAVNQKTFAYQWDET